MSALDLPALEQELVTRVRASTGNRLRNLGVAVCPTGVRLSGQTTTFYVKQLAQESIRKVLPGVSLINEINVLAA